MKIDFFEIKKLLREFSDEDLLFISRKLDSKSNALIFFCLPTSRSEWLLSNFPPETFSEVISAFPQIKNDSTIIQNVFHFLTTVDSPENLEAAVARRLHKLDSFFSSKILAHLKDSSPVFFQKVISEQKSFVELSDSMEIFNWIDDRGIQRILTEFSGSEFGVALIPSSEAVRERIKSNVSKNRWESISDEFKRPGFKNSPLEIKKWQTEILKKIRSLEKNGEVVIEGRKNFFNDHKPYEPN